MAGNPQVRVPRPLVPYVLLLVHLYEQKQAGAILVQIKTAALETEEPIAS